MGIQVRATIFVAFMGCGMLLGASPSNTINEIFHHKGHPDHTDLELGKVVLYFAQTPTIAPHSVRKNKTLEEWIVEMPSTRPNKTVCNGICEQKNDAGLMYRVVLKKVSDAQKEDTTHLIIQYDPQRVVPEYALFDSISQQKGLVIRFHNKNLLDRMRKHEQAALRVAQAKKPPLVILDIGHGGSDHGAVGCNRVCEKEITLAIGKQVANLLNRQGINTRLTRDEDVFVALDARTTLANACDASLFVSIHANASPRVSTSGIETYCLAPQLFSDAHITSRHIYAGATEESLNALYVQSNALAKAIHSHVLQAATRACSTMVCDRGVKHSVAQVLLGVKIPSVLVEVGFLSNPQEAHYLASDSPDFYRQALARGIYDGIVAFL